MGVVRTACGTLFESTCAPWFDTELVHQRIEGRTAVCCALWEEIATRPLFATKETQHLRSKKFALLRPQFHEADLLHKLVSRIRWCVDIAR